MMNLMISQRYRMILLIIVGIHLVFVGTVSPIMVREISSKTNMEMLASPSTDKFKKSSEKLVENVTIADDERHKRILPYLEFYSQRTPQMLTVAQYNERNPKIHIVVPIDPSKRFKSPHSNHQKPHKEILVQFTKYNAQPGPFVPIAKKPPPPPPNFSEIYDKLSQLKMLQLNSLESPTYTRLKPIKPSTSRPFVSIQAIGNHGKGPPINKPAKTIIYVPSTPLRNDFYPIQVQDNKKHQNDYYDSFGESALTHNNKQYFYEHPVVVQNKPQSTFLPINPNQQHGMTSYDYQSFYNPRLQDYYNIQGQNQPPKYELVNPHVNHPPHPIIYEDEYDYDDMAEKPSKIYPVLEYGTKHQKLTPQVNAISPQTVLGSSPKPEQEKKLLNHLVPDSMVPAPPQLVEIISQNTMKYYQNTPSSTASVPNLSEETAKKNQGVQHSPNSGLTIAQTNHKEQLDYDQSSESDYKNTVDSSQNDSSLNNLLKKLQETNTLPKTFTVDNIDNSIKTLVHILSSLKKHKKLLQPLVPNDNNYHQYDDTENEAEDPISTENFPGDTPEGGTPGRPGIDYPALSVIPPTSFDCKTQRYKGFFADPETQCQVWHYCDLNGGQASFLCPNGTTFSQVALTCDWWYNVKCANTPQLYVLNERLYKYIIPLTPKFPEDYSGPLVDKYLAIKFKEMEEKMKKQKKGKKPSEQKTESEEETTSEENDSMMKDKKEDESLDPSIVTLSEVNQ